MGFQYIIAKVLKYIYQKWGCIFHFKLWVKSYGNKKRQKPIWQFDSKSLILEKNVQVIFKLNMWYGVEKILSKGTTSCVWTLQSQIICESYEPMKFQDS